VTELFLVQLRADYVERCADETELAPRVVRAFTSRHDAESLLRALEARSTCPPGYISPLGAYWTGSGYIGAWMRRQDGSLEHKHVKFSELTSMGQETFLALATRLGFPPPPMLSDTRPDVPWHEWWREVVAAGTEAQRLPLWAALDRVSFFEIATVPCEI
jgi:hypothetical protein